MKNITRITWMLFWRFFLIGIVISFIAKNETIRNPLTVLAISIILSVLIHKSGRTLTETPLRDLSKWRSPFIDFHRAKTTPEIFYRKLDKASAQGSISGFEPRSLDNIPIPSSNHMHGNPGIGLNSAHNVMSAKNIQAGQKGEVNFSKALRISDGHRIDYKRNDGLINQFESFWSVAMPDENNPHEKDKKFNTDIDCILVSGNQIILIDAKFYKSGDVTYYAQGNTIYCRDNTTGIQVGDPKEMSRNMQMALDRFKKLYPSYKVSAYVVLMPTNSGTAQIDNVIYPGGIPLVHPQWLLSRIKNIAGNKTSPYIISNLNNLLK